MIHKVALIWVLPAYIGLSLIYGILWYQDNQTDERVQKENAIALASTQYGVAVNQYHRQVEETRNCVLLIQTEQKIRMSFQDLYDGIEEEFPNATALVERLRLRLDKTLPPKDIQVECPPLPEEPPIPPLVREFLQQEGTPLGN